MAKASSENTGLHEPQFTVAICTWNRAQLLRQTLTSFTALRVPPGVTWELLVCDNHSPDGTRAVVESFAGRLPVRYVCEERLGLAFARNAAIGEARGRWLLWTDDDVQVDADWLAGFAEGIARYPQAVFFGGGIEPWIGAPLTRTARFVLENYGIVLTVQPIEADAPVRLGAKLPAGANMAIRRDVQLREAFDTTLGVAGTWRGASEDVEMVMRLQRAGGEGWMLARPMVRHYLHPRRLPWLYF